MRAWATRLGANQLMFDSDYAEASLKHERRDFVDIMTSPDTHAQFVHIAAHDWINVICHKPMASDLHTAEQTVAACGAAGIRFLVHENWRWPTPLRAFKAALDRNDVGRPFRGLTTFSSSFRQLAIPTRT